MLSLTRRSGANGRRHPGAGVDDISASLTAISDWFVGDAWVSYDQYDNTFPPDDSQRISSFVLAEKQWACDDFEIEILNDQTKVWIGASRRRG